MRTRRRLLWYGLAAALVAVAFALAEAPVALRLLVGLPTVLLVPGYGLVEALDPRGRLRGTERLTISLAGSVSIAILTGLLLAASPAGLGTPSWAAGLGWLAVLTTLLGLHRTRVAAGVPSSSAPSRRRTGVTAAAVFVLMIGTALLIVISGETLGSEQQVERGDTGILQLWAKPAEDGQIEVGFENPTDTAIECTLQVRQGPTLVREQELLLSPGTQTMSIAPPEGGSVLFPVDVMLLDEHGASVLRRVSIWLPARKSGATDASGAKG